MTTDTPTLDPAQLEDILSYYNEDVLSRFTDMFEVTDEEAFDLFQETKKFLFVCQVKGIFIPDDLLILDEMWHNFILFTKEYHAFCNRYFNRYFHHLPASKKEKEDQKRNDLEDPESARTLYLQKLEHVINTVYDQLGEETVIKWFKTYPETYSKEKIKQLRKI
ncbi:MAG: hypothetical protein ACTHLE_09725 [Agriterribacter sp.]